MLPSGPRPGSCNRERVLTDLTPLHTLRKRGLPWNSHVISTARYARPSEQQSWVTSALPSVQSDPNMMYVCTNCTVPENKIKRYFYSRLSSLLKIFKIGRYLRWPAGRSAKTFIIIIPCFDSIKGPGPAHPSLAFKS